MTTTDLQAAIDRSRTHNEIVVVEVGDPRNEARALVLEDPSRHDWTDDPAAGGVDVWGPDWRLRLVPSGRGNLEP